MKVDIFESSCASRVHSIPFYLQRISAGFPSPAQGYEKQELNLHEYCVRHPSATYFLRVSGSSMEDGRIHDGDVLVVDRSLTASHGSIVVACIHNEFTVKRLLLRPRPCLMPMNKDFPVYYIDPDNESVEIWGVVTHSLIEHPVCLR
nr:translesion error-prone DNA polymerase V autoproteolytic subunit MucA [Escherichia coli]